MKKSTLLKALAWSGSLPLFLCPSCSKGPEAAPPQNEAIEFYASISSVTRSTIDWADFKCEFETGDAIGIFAVPHGSPLAESGNYANNVQLVKQADGAWEYADPDQVIFFPAEGVTLDIYAYYPYTESPFDPTALPFDVGTDQSEGAAESELLWGSATDIAEEDNRISLTFAHMLSMIQVEISPAGDSAIRMEDIASIEIKLNGVESALSFHIGEGSTTPSGETGRIKMERNGETFQFRALIPVQPITAGSILFSCTVGIVGDNAENSYTQFNYEAGPNTTLEKGVVRLYDIKLP